MGLGRVKGWCQTGVNRRRERKKREKTGIQLADVIFNRANQTLTVNNVCVQQVQEDPEKSAFCGQLRGLSLNT